jgi:hypothetical protein
MGRLKKWPKVITPYFEIVNVRGRRFVVRYTEFGSQQSSIYQAMARLNDSNALLTLGLTSHFVPPMIQVACQSLLWNRQFDAATEVALRGFWVLQLSLPPGFVPLQSKFDPSPARLDFLNLVAFLARFAFRRNCFQTSMALWQLGLAVTDDDPANFALLAAVPALYAGAADYVTEMIESEREWHGVPIRYIPDWPLVRALLNPEDIEGLAREIARWPFVFEEYGIPCELQLPPVLGSLATVFRRRIAKYCEKREIAEAIGNAAELAACLDEDEEQATAMSFWFGVSDVEIEFGNMDEEAVMPAG